MLKRLGSVALVVQAGVLAVLLLAPQADALWQEGWDGVAGYGVVSVPARESHTTVTPPAPGAPVITSFTPIFGTPLSYVQITGANFEGVTSVTFGGVPADKFLFFPNSGIARVPLDALTGPISISNALGTGVSHDNFTVGSLDIGAKNLRVEFSGTGPARASWDQGAADISYYVLRTDLSPAPPTAIGPLQWYFYDEDAVPLTLYCYLVLPTFESTVLGVSDLECAESGLRSGTVVPQYFSMALNQSNYASLNWGQPLVAEDAFVITAIPLNAQPTQHVVLPPNATAYAYDTGGVPTCFLLLGVRVGPPFDYGMTNLLCGVPGISDLGLDMAMTKDELGKRVRTALAGLKLPNLRETLVGAQDALRKSRQPHGD